MARSLQSAPQSSEITPEDLYLRRREFIQNALYGAATATAVGGGLLRLIGGKRASDPARPAAVSPAMRKALASVTPSKYGTSEPKTDVAAVTSYNNFYEFGTDKSDPAARATSLKLQPWTMTIDGEVHSPLVLDVDQLLRWFPLEERVYRMRCVEAWSMVIPWLGFPLGDLLRRAEPTSRARYVTFTALYDLEQMPEQRRLVLDWT